MKHKTHHKKSGQWCFKCHKYIEKIPKVKKLEPILVSDYLR